MEFTFKNLDVDTWSNVANPQRHMKVYVSTLFWALGCVCKFVLRCKIFYRIGPRSYQGRAATKFPSTLIFFTCALWQRIAIQPHPTRSVFDKKNFQYIFWTILLVSIRSAKFMPISFMSIFTKIGHHLQILRGWLDLKFWLHQKRSFTFSNRHFLFKR